MTSEVPALYSSDPNLTRMKREVKYILDLVSQPADLERERLLTVHREYLGWEGEPICPLEWFINTAASALISRRDDAECCTVYTSYFGVGISAYETLVLPFEWSYRSNHLIEAQASHDVAWAIIKENSPDEQLIVEALAKEHKVLTAERLKELGKQNQIKYQEELEPYVTGIPPKD